MREMWVWFLGREGGDGNPLEKEMATHSSILAWEILWTEEPVRPQSMGSQRVRHDSLSLSLTHTHIHTHNHFPELSNLMFIHYDVVFHPSLNKISHIWAFMSSTLAHKYNLTKKHWALQVVLVVKNLPVQGDTRDIGSIPVSGRSPGEGHGNSLQ